MQQNQVQSYVKVNRQLQFDSEYIHKHSQTPFNKNDINSQIKRDQYSNFSSIVGSSSNKNQVQLSEKQQNNEDYPQNSDQQFNYTPKVHIYNKEVILNTQNMNKFSDQNTNTMKNLIEKDPQKYQQKRSVLSEDPRNLYSQKKDQSKNEKKNNYSFQPNPFQPNIHMINNEQQENIPPLNIDIENIDNRKDKFNSTSYTYDAELAKQRSIQRQIKMQKFQMEKPLSINDLGKSQNFQVPQVMNQKRKFTDTQKNLQQEHNDKIPFHKNNQKLFQKFQQKQFRGQYANSNNNSNNNSYILENSFESDNFQQKQSSNFEQNFHKNQNINDSFNNSESSYIIPKIQKKKLDQKDIDKILDLQKEQDKNQFQLHQQNLINKSIEGSCIDNSTIEANNSSFENIQNDLLSISQSLNNSIESQYIPEKIQQKQNQSQKDNNNSQEYVEHNKGQNDNQFLQKQEQFYKKINGKYQHQKKQGLGFNNNKSLKNSNIQFVKNKNSDQNQKQNEQCEKINQQKFVQNCNSQIYNNCNEKKQENKNYIQNEKEEGEIDHQQDQMEQEQNFDDEMMEMKQYFSQNSKQFKEKQPKNSINDEDDLFDSQNKQQHKYNQYEDNEDEESDFYKNNFYEKFNKQKLTQKQKHYAEKNKENMKFYAPYQNNFVKPQRNSYNDYIKKEKTDFYGEQKQKGKNIFVPLYQEGNNSSDNSLPELSLQQQNMVYKYWEERHFNDVNFWIQKAHADLLEDSKQVVSEISSNRHFIYTLTLILRKQDKTDPIIETGTGKSKKEAKRNAFKNLAAQIIFQGYLKYGLKDRRMNKFEDACQKLAIIMNLREPIWADISSMWKYSIERKSLNHLQQYGFQRSESNNPFDIEDSTLMLDEEIKNCQHKMTKNQLDEIIVKEIKKNFFQNIRQIESINNQNSGKYNSQIVQIMPQSYLNPSHIEDKNLQSFLKDQYLARLQNSPQENQQLMPKDPAQYINQLQHQIKSEIINNMFDYLLFCEDLQFALQACELIYTKIYINIQEFKEIHAGNYFLNQRTLITQEQIEIIHKSYLNPTKLGVLQYNTLKGICEVTNQNAGILQVEFNPSESPEVIENKVFQNTGMNTYKDWKFQDEDFCLLVSFFEPSDIHPRLNEKDISQIARYLNNLSYIKDHSDAIPVLKDITEQGRTVEFALFAQIKNITKSGMNLKIQVQPNEQIWQLCKLTNLDNYKNQVQALLDCSKDIKMSHSIQKLILAPPKSNSKYIQNLAETIIEKEAKSQNLKLQVNSFLNKTQYFAILSAVRQITTVIQCPLSSGKSKILVKIVEQWLYSNGLKILIVVKDEETLEQIYTLLNSLNINAVKMCLKGIHKLGQLKTTMNKSRVGIIDKNGSSQFLANSRDFQKVIIMDAQNISEQQTLTFLNKNYKKDNVSNLAKSRGYGLSLYENLIKKGVQPIFVNPMHKENNIIGEFLSLNYYQAKLEIASEQKNTNDAEFSPFKQKIFSQNFKNLLFEKNLVFNEDKIAAVQVPGCEIKYMNSIINISEIKCVVQLVVFLLGHGILTPKDIGIVTPYLQQSKLIYRELRLQAQNNPDLFQQKYQDNNLNIEISTINDNYNTRNFIIFSSVRANKFGDLGLLSDYKILNQLLGKSKKGFILLGDLPTLNFEKSWQVFIQSQIQNNRLYQIDQFE
ncbi:P-loop containing nucleoside triphosphate hydrolase [Pseudocohnilembus persalinus]|uniref:p-loop containing nucleoside triphosphate hydrolase n=1 Tax=Pseudocohnilembus persalinus TaxID=266149 RepID=A0A0V0QNY8_PSEPJ|nr:P-loop containing nucleoside triphosphate hydrolase [Pseudocohnilembus persalinus]|eukprot:KRX03998.1 P-loop containing nucleoside triphosphate hydrolase [Pseudocohnilembus persalinus]